MVTWVSAFGLSNNKMAMVSVVNWQPTGGLMVQAYRLGPKVGGHLAPCCTHRVNHGDWWTLAMLQAWRQHHKHCRGIIIIIYYHMNCWSTISINDRSCQQRCITGPVRELQSLCGRYDLELFLKLEGVISCVSFMIRPTHKLGCVKLFICCIISGAFYRAMHFSAKRGIAIACRLSVRLSVCLSVCL